MAAAEARRKLEERGKKIAVRGTQAAPRVHSVAAAVVEAREKLEERGKETAVRGTRADCVQQFWGAFSKSVIWSLAPLNV